MLIGDEERPVIRPSVAQPLRPGLVFQKIEITKVADGVLTIGRLKAGDDQVNRHLPIVRTHHHRPSVEQYGRRPSLNTVPTEGLVF